VTELWHLSEDPTIEIFVPHRAPTSAVDEKLVWAVDSEQAWLYWFPRDCPRATWCAGVETSADDVERWLDGDRSRRIALIETRWLERMNSVELYAYRFPPESFEPWDKFFISRETIVPVELVALGDLVQQHAEGGTELRVADSLYPLWDEVVATTLDFSGIRLRNAVN
jgi:hypothetical protein